MKRFGQKESFLMLQHKFDEIKQNIDKIQRKQANFIRMESHKFTKDNSLRETPSSYLSQISPNSKNQQLMSLIRSLQQEKNALQEDVKEIASERDSYQLQIENLKKESQRQSSLIEELTRENKVLRQKPGRSSLSSCLKKQYSTPKKHRVSFSKELTTIFHFNDQSLGADSENQPIDLRKKPSVVKSLNTSETQMKDSKKLNVERAISQTINENNWFK